MTQKNKLKTGEIWLANLNPSRGTEPGKTRPVLVIQDQALLDAEHPSTLIIPLTTNIIDDAEPLRIRISATHNLKHPSDALIDQIRAIDNIRLIDGPLTNCNKQTMKDIYSAINEVIGNI